MEREGAGGWLGSGPTPAPSWHAVGAVAPGTGPLSGQDRQLLRGVGESGSEGGGFFLSGIHTLSLFPSAVPSQVLIAFCVSVWLKL